MMKLVMIYLIIINFIAFTLMGVDKRKAIRGAWRIPEKVLFLSAVFGGAIGAWIGMYVFRHKTKHWYFVVGMPLILFLQIGITLFLSGCGVHETSNIKDGHIKVEDNKENKNKQNAKKKTNRSTANKDKDQLTLIMVGDILLHDPVEAAAKQSDGSYNYDAIFANTKDLIQNADLALVNQEVIIGGEEIGVGGYPAFNAPYEMADALVNAGFDVVCHGTNHALDRGATGIQNCTKNWQEKYPQIAVLGIHDTRESADDICIIEKNGMRIAILNYTYGTNGIAPPKDMPYAVDYLSEESVIADIKRAEEEADFTVVCPHWGTEYYLEADAMQKKWAKLFAENGVDLVLGTHPHVIGPMEQIDHMLVYYSLGNFVNWTSDSGAGIANRMIGGMAQVTLKKDDTGNVIIDEHQIIPLVSHVTTGTNGVTVYPLDAYTDALANENEIRNQDSSFSLSYCKDLVNRVW